MDKIPERVTAHEILLARRAPLAEYLLNQYPDEYKLAGQSVISVLNPSLSISVKIPGFMDFHTGEHGNPVDFLKSYKGCSFQEAVYVLNRFMKETTFNMSSSHVFALVSRPLANDYGFTEAARYLTAIGIPEPTVKSLYGMGLLYEDTRNNVVFSGPREDYFEIHGTGGIPFYRCLKGCDSSYWLLPSSQKPVTAYVCTSAVDAISLSLLKREKSSSTVFISIGDLNCQNAVVRISASAGTVLAVGHDRAGRLLREKFPWIPVIYSKYATWNEDLRRR